MAGQGSRRAGPESPGQGRGFVTRQSGRVEREASVDASAGPPRWSFTRLVFLAITGISLYFLLPNIAEVLTTWNRLGAIDPGWVAVIVVCAIASFVCQWELQAITLNTNKWFPLVTSQLAANAFNKITPGGGVTGTAFQASLLADAGFPLTAAATGLTVQSILSSATVVAMPVFALPAVLAGSEIPEGLAEAAWIGLSMFVLMAVIGLVLFTRDRALCAIGDVVEKVAAMLHTRRRPQPALGARMVAARNEIREQMGSRWPAALVVSLARWGFEYLILLVALHAVGADPNPSLVLLAFVAAMALGLLPFTPGGLGFVEAGLVGTLALAGIKGGPALVATLAYRLVTFWIPLPVGAVAAFMFRRRFPRRGVRAAKA